MTEHDVPEGGRLTERRPEEAEPGDGRPRPGGPEAEGDPRRIDALVYAKEAQSAALAGKARQLREALEAFDRAVVEYHAAQEVVLPNRHQPFDGLDQHAIQWEKRYLRLVEESEGDPLAIEAWLDAELGPAT